MRCPDVIEDEAQRLVMLGEYGLSSEMGLPSLDPIVDIAVRLFQVPAAAVNMIGSDHVFFAASSGIGECDMGRDISFCAHAITQGEVMVVEDARLDPRFHDNPLVLDGFIRFYAGVPLLAPSGHALGALCIVDSEPRAGFGTDDRARLKDLARLAADKLELRRLERSAELGASRFEASALTSPNAVICFDAGARISAWNAAAEKMFGYRGEDVLGQPVDRLVIAAERHKVLAGIACALAGECANDLPTQLTGRRQDGTDILIEFSWSRWQEAGQMHFGTIVRDITDQRREQEILFKLANYDALTGLPNRNFLHQRAAEALEQGAAALIIADLDGFKDINDTLGHSIGDAVLQVVGERLNGIVAQPDLVARIGGDEFATLLLDCSDPRTLGAMTQAILDAIAEPIVVDGQEIRISGSCGLTLAQGHGDTVDAFMSSADLALFQAKTTGGRGRSFLFTPALRAEASARRMYDVELHNAVEQGEFELFYQPQLRLSDGALTGAEALIRWRHPVRDLLAPSAFLPAVEAGALAATIGTWVLGTACKQAAKWRRVQPDFRMSVNLFAAQFRANDLASTVAAALASAGLPPEALELEITENIILDQEERVLHQLQAVRELGVDLSFDDFGTGYASLNLLKAYPVSFIKIDKSFTQAIGLSEQDRAIVRSLLDLAHRLGLEVVAEGIEEEPQHRFLREHGCEKGQGYLFGKPVSADLFWDQFWPSDTMGQKG
ncbi:MAG TPA: EAL domain-containing protein [Sphingobium sp.]